MTSVTVEKIWGSFTNLFERPDYLVKQLVVHPHHRLSLQSHKYRSEMWTVVKGNGIVTLGNVTFPIPEESGIYIPKSTQHRLENEEEEDLIIIEVQMGEYIDEADIVRHEDDYGREGTTEL